MFLFLAYTLRPIDRQVEFDLQDIKNVSQSTLASSYWENW